LKLSTRGTVHSLRVEAGALYFSALGEKKALEALGWRDDGKRKAIIAEIRERGRWYVNREIARERVRQARERGLGSASRDTDP
jgi:hypothetical protein